MRRLTKPETSAGNFESLRNTETNHTRHLHRCRPYVA